LTQAGSNLANFRIAEKPPSDLLDSGVVSDIGILQQLEAR